MKLLITGATGFVGKTLIPYLLKSNKDLDLCLIVRNISKSEKLFEGLKISYILTDESMRQKIIEFNPEVVIHLATYFTTTDRENQIEPLIDTNILFTSRLLEALKESSCKYFINTGTFTESLFGSGDSIPANLYSATKAACRPIIKYFQEVSDWKWINVVIYSPYGREAEKKKVIDYLLDALDSDTPIAFTNGYQILDFIHVDDIANFYLTLLQKLDNIDDKFTEFHLGTGNGSSIRDVAKIIEQATGQKINANWGALPINPMNPIHAVAPVSYIGKKLNWHPNIDLVKGISILINDISKTKE